MSDFFSGDDILKLAIKAREGVNDPNLTPHDAAIYLIAFALMSYVGSESEDETQ